MRSLRVLVYPHTMEIGGSQLNAIEIAAAVRRLGHEVILYAPDGELVPYARSLGLEHVRARRAPFHPAPAVSNDLARLVRSRGIDVVHGYEWPPALEAFAACALARRAAPVATVMSMSVPPFLPRSMPLVLGTRRLVRSVSGQGRTVHLLEPPVDTVANRPGVGAEQFRAAYPVDPDVKQVVVVSRLARELKLEGIITAVRAVSTLAERRRVRLVVVGDGPAAGEVQSAVAAANDASGREVVLLTGALSDPRGAYASADVCLGMGGSALRALAFGKAMIVQGERGFFEALTEETVAMFLEQGWYGVADRTAAEAVRHLSRLLEKVLDDDVRRAELGRFGRQLITERFSLERAAEVQLDIYRRAVAARPAFPRVLAEGARAGAAVVRHKARRRVARLWADVPLDDFNARPV